MGTAAVAPDQGTYQLTARGLAPQRYITGYFRISDADDDEGVTNQGTWFAKWAEESYPGQPTRTFADNDITGSTEDRDGFQALLDAISRGEVAELWVRDCSRLQRDELIWFQLRKTMLDNGLYLLHTHDDGTVGVDALVTGILACVDADRRRKDRKHVLDRQDEDAAKGRPHGATPFGLERATIEGERTYVQDSERAVIVRWLVDEIFSGRSTTSLGKELKDQGVHGSAGGLICTSAQVEQIVTNPSIAGLRRHRGTIIGPGNWYERAILSEDEWRDVCAVVEQRRKAAKADSRKGGAARRSYPLSGAAWCVRCESSMGGVNKRQSRGRPHVRLYWCRVCGTSISARETEDLVFDAVQAKLEALSELNQALTADDSEARRSEIHAALEGIDARRRILADQWGEGDLDDVEWQTAREAMNRRRDELQAELAGLTRPEGADDPDAVAHAMTEARLTACDDTAEPELRREAADTLRAIVAEYTDRIEIAPSVRGRPLAERVNIGWFE